MAKKKQETKNNKKEKKEVVVKEEKVVKEVPKKESKKESKKDTKKVNKVNDDKVFKMLEFFDKYRLAIYGAVGGILITVLVVVIIWPDRIATLKDGTQPVAEIDNYTVTADDLYEDMKELYSISSLLDKIDNKILYFLVYNHSKNITIKYTKHTSIALLLLTFKSFIHKHTPKTIINKINIRTIIIKVT